MVMKRDMAALLVALSVYRVASTGTPLPGEGRGGWCQQPLHVEDSALPTGQQGQLQQMAESVTRRRC